MIVRILGEGRYDVPDGDIPAIEQLDNELVQTLDRGDEAAFAATLRKLIERVRTKGSLVPADDVRTSELAVPHQDATLDEVRALLAEGA